MTLKLFYVRIFVMSKKDEKNAQIGMWKYWLGIAVASFLAICSYLVTQIKVLDSWLILVGCFAIMGLFVAIVFITLRINKHIRDLRDL